MNKEKKTASKITKILSPERLAMIVIVLTMTMNAITLARYKTITSGMVTVKVAKWDVSVSNLSSNTINIIAGNTTQDYRLQVRNNSEVSCTYSIVISNISNDIKVSLDDGSDLTPSNNQITISNAGTFNIGDGNLERTHKLTFKAPISAAAVTNMTGNIRVIVTQKD